MSYSDPGENPYETPEVSGEAGHAADESLRRSHLLAEALIRGVGFIYFVGAIGQGISLLRRLNFGLDPWQWLEGLLYTAAFLACGCGLERLRPWGRSLATVLAAISLLRYPSGTVQGLLILFAVHNQKARTILSPQYDQVRRLTPHVSSTWQAFLFATGIVVVFALGNVLYLRG